MLYSCIQHNNVNKNYEIEVFDDNGSFSGIKDGVKYILLHYSDIPDLNRWMRVSQGCNQYINQVIWPEIAKRITIKNFPLKDKNQIKDIVISLKKKSQEEVYQDWVFFETTMQTRVNLFCKSLSIENIPLLNSVAIARNIIAIVKVLEGMLPNAPKLENMDFNNFAPDELEGAMEKCINWCSDNQKALNDLAILDLSGKKLTLLPVEILKFLPNLRSLNLSNNQLCSASEIANLCPGLQILDLSFNCVTSFDGLENLTKLVELNLAKNGLTSIPIEICGVHHLRYLNLSRNWITSIPLQISQMVNLTDLNLSYNRITSLPTTTLVALKNLIQFDLSGNAAWISVPDEFWQTPLAQITWGLRDGPKVAGKVASKIVDFVILVAGKRVGINFHDY